MTAPKTAPTRPNSDDEGENRIIDAALVQFEKVGIKKTTIEEVARQAGVDRATVYRRIGSRDDLVHAVMNREIMAVLAEVAEIPDRHDALADLTADIFITVITRWRTHPLAARLLALEPERVLSKLTTDSESVFTMCVSATAAALEQAAQRGLLDSGTDLITRAEIVCRIVHSMILSPHGVVPLETDEELAAFAHTYLVPIITGPVPAA